MSDDPKNGSSTLRRSVTCNVDGSLGPRAFWLCRKKNGGFPSWLLRNKCGGGWQKPRETTGSFFWLAETARFFGDVTIVPFDAAALTVYERLRHTHRGLGAQDLKIAAIALARGSILVTPNVADSREMLVDFAPNPTELASVDC